MRPRFKSPSLRRRTVFYGWRIVVLGFILNLMMAGLGASGFSVFVKPMGDDLGWSRSSIVAASTLGMVATALTGHFLGSLLDKKNGARLLTTLGMFVLGLAAIGMGAVQDVWQFLLLFFAAGAFGLYAYPALITPTILSKWFVRRRGMAISFASMGLSSSGLIISPYANLLISKFGWRTAWPVLGVTVWALAVPWCFMFMRGRPEDMGLNPDGDPMPRAGDREKGLIGPAPTHEYPWTVREAMRTRAFWLLLISSSMGMMAFMGVLINFFAFATDEKIGFSDGQATIAFAAFSIMSLLGKFPWAYLSDRIDIRYSTAFTYAVPAIAVAILLNASNFWMLVLWGMVFGSGISGISPLPALSWGSYYGRTFLGSIRGITSPVAFLTQAAAPLFAALMYDATGGYETPFTIFLGIFLVSSFLMFFARRPATPILLPSLSA